MYKFPNSIVVNDTTQLIVRQQSDTSLIADIVKNEKINNAGGETNKHLGKLYAYHDSSPQLEDQNKHWNITIYTVPESLEKKDAEEILNVLENNNITQPLILYVLRMYNYNPSKDFSVKRGKVFLDD
jgi:hypothetical protein